MPPPNSYDFTFTIKRKELDKMVCCASDKVILVKDPEGEIIGAAVLDVWATTIIGYVKLMDTDAAEILKANLIDGIINHVRLGPKEKLHDRF